MEQGLMIVLSGPAGSGKSSVRSHLREHEDFVYSVSLTTRGPRPGETEGVDYRYVTTEAFEERIANKDLIEYTHYCGNYYGTPLHEAMEVINSGRNLILEIEVEGAQNIKRLYPNSVLIMLLPPSYSVQEARLRGRATEPEDKILARLARTREEVSLADRYDYVVYNYEGQAERCADDIRAIVRAEKCAIKRHPDVADTYFKN